MEMADFLCKWRDEELLSIMSLYRYVYVPTFNHLEAKLHHTIDLGGWFRDRSGSRQPVMCGAHSF